jgi:hypothetical protein
VCREQYPELEAIAEPLSQIAKAPEVFGSTRAGRFDLGADDPAVRMLEHDVDFYSVPVPKVIHGATHRGMVFLSIDRSHCEFA